MLFATKDQAVAAREAITAASYEAYRAYRALESGATLVSWEKLSDAGKAQARQLVIEIVNKERTVTTRKELIFTHVIAAFTADIVTKQEGATV